MPQCGTAAAECKPFQEVSTKLKNSCRNGLVARRLLLGSLLLLLPGLVLACQRGQADSLPPAAAASPSPAARGGGVPGAPQPAAAVSVPQVKPDIVLRTYSGEVRAKDQVSVTSKVSGRIEQIKVRAGDAVKAGEVLVVLEHSALDAAVKQAEATVASKEANLKKVQGGPRPEAVAAVQADLDSAKAKLDALLAGPTPEQVNDKQAALGSAQAKLAQRLAGPTKEQIQEKQDTLEMAKRDRLYQEAYADVQVSQALGKMPTYSFSMREGLLGQYDQKIQIAAHQLDTLLAPPSPDEIAQLQAAVDQAKAQVDILTAKPKAADIAQLQSAIDKAKAQLDLAKNPYTDYDLAVAQSDVALARAALDAAQVQQAESFLHSPVDGYVLTRDLAPGSMAPVAASVLTVVSREVEVVFSAEEKALGQVAPGKTVSLTTVAATDIPGEITAVAPAANRATRTFDVYVKADASKGLVPGMFATVSLPQ